jgi:molybdopterin synthase sulfur carrier subunit
MNVSVEIAFSFKRELDAEDRRLELSDGATVHQALQALAARSPQIAERLFDDRGEIRRYINVLINGGNVQFKRRFETILRDGDRLTILPPVGGG